jgi:hypothetical protein
LEARPEVSVVVVVVAESAGDALVASGLEGEGGLGLGSGLDIMSWLNSGVYMIAMI